YNPDDERDAVQVGRLRAVRAFVWRAGFLPRSVRWPWVLGGWQAVVQRRFCWTLKGLADGRHPELSCTDQPPEVVQGRGGRAVRSELFWRGFPRYIGTSG